MEARRCESHVSLEYRLIRGVPENSTRRRSKFGLTAERSCARSHMAGITGHWALATDVVVLTYPSKDSGQPRQKSGGPGNNIKSGN